MNRWTDLPGENGYDVLVCGSGMGGVAAACAAAESGLKVGVIEYFGELGGIPVSGGLGSISGFARAGVTAVAGFAREFADSLGRRGKNCVQSGGQNINLPPAEIDRRIWELFDFYGVEARLYTQVIDAVTEDGRIVAAVTAAKEGLRRIPAEVFIDATGDGDLAARAHAPFAVGRESDGKVQSATLIFIIGGIDRARLPEYLDIRKVWKSTPRPVPIDHSVFQFVPHNGATNEIAVNMTHCLNADPLSAKGLTAIRRECVRQAHYLMEEFFRNEIPGFEHAWISRFAPQIGVRESRRILGDYLLTVDDVLAGRHFPDEIAQGIWSIDVHNPDGVHTGVSQRLERTYGIPWRCITPRGIRNLLIAGRPISADHVAFSSSRINATCMAVGEAAGSAAAQVIAAGNTRKIDVAALLERLRSVRYRAFASLD